MQTTVNARKNDLKSFQFDPYDDGIVDKTRAYRILKALVPISTRGTSAP
jgi:hypothetical protein